MCVCTCIYVCVSFAILFFFFLPSLEPDLCHHPETKLGGWTASKALCEQDVAAKEFRRDPTKMLQR